MGDISDDITPVSSAAVVPTATQQKIVAQLNLFTRLAEAEAIAKGVTPSKATGATTPAPSRILLLIGGAVLLVGGAAVAWMVTRPKTEPAVVVQPSPSHRPTPSPSIKPSPRPTPPPPAPPPPAPNTYTVQPGDTLITIGDKLHKDWHAIAAANGNIQDPNLIYPGQVLTIP